MRAVGSVADQQVQRGLPGQALLRRQRHHRRRRVAGDRPREGAVRCRPRQRPAAQRCQRQHVRVPGAARSRATPCSGLSLDHGGHLTHGSPVNASGKLYHFVAYKVTPGRRAHRHGPGPRPRARAPTEDDRRRHHQLPAALDPEPFRAIADEVGALFLFDAAHIAGLIAGGVAPEPGAVRRRRHVHHAQDAARSARRLHPQHGRARGGDRQGRVPRLAGRPARARHRRQGRRLLRGAAAELPRLRPADRHQRQRAGRGARCSRASVWSAAAPTTT